MFGALMFRVSVLAFGIAGLSRLYGLEALVNFSRVCVLGWMGFSSWSLPFLGSHATPYYLIIPRAMKICAPLL